MTEEVLAPELTQFIDAGQRTVAALLGRNSQLDALAAFEVGAAAARNFLERSRRVLERVAPTVPPDDERQNVLDEMRRTFDHSTSAVDAMQEAVESQNLGILQGALNALEESLANLQECARTLQTMDHDAKAALPFPALERLAAGVRSFRAGTADLESVQPLLLAAVAQWARLDRQIRLFAASEPDQQPLVQEALELTLVVADGLGAMSQALEEGQDLTAAVERLSAAWPVAGLLREMERITAASRSFSKFAALETCHRYLSRMRNVPAADRPLLDRAAVERAEALCDVLARDAERYSRLPVAFVVPDAATRAQKRVVELRQHLDRFRQQLDPGDANTMLALCTLRDAAEATQTATFELRAELQAALDRTDSFPRLELLRERVGRLLQGTLSLKHFLIDFSGLAAQLEQLYRQAISQGQAGAALAAILAEQRAGFERISRYFNDPVEVHLIEGWHQIEATLGGLQVLRRTLPERSLQRGLSETMPDLLIRLTEWRSGVAEGTLAAATARARVRDEIRRLRDLRKEAHSRFTHLLKTSPSWVQGAMQSYLDNITQLIGGLEVLEGHLAAGRTPAVGDGFEQVRTTILAMEMESQRLAG